MFHKEDQHENKTHTLYGSGVSFGNSHLVITFFQVNGSLFE